MGGGATKNTKEMTSRDETLTNDEIARCRRSWGKIIDEGTLFGSSSNEETKNHELVLRLSQLLQEEETRGGIPSLPHLKHIPHFVQSMFQIIQLCLDPMISLQQFSSKMLSITKTMFVINGARYEHLLFFQRSLNQLMIRTLQEDNYDLSTRLCWSKLMKSIHQRILFLYPTLNVEYLKNTESERMYTAYSNSVPF
jgi:hypothetical protein